MKKTAIFGILAFVLTFFGLFALINLLVVVIFPITWNEVVTTPVWLMVYFFLGLGPSILVTEEVTSKY